MQAAPHTQQDIRDLIFAGIKDRIYNAQIIAERDGVISGTSRLQAFLAETGIKADIYVNDGDNAAGGAVIARITGTPKQIAVAEEQVIGCLAKPSGIATAARRAVELAGSDLRIVCGAWKKMPPEMKHVVREAVAAAKVAFRIVDQPFLYLDKNFVRMLGGIETTLAAVSAMDDKVKVIQVKGCSGDIAAEALAAVRGGAGVVMIDTGRIADVDAVNAALAAAGCRQNVKVAFAKGIQVDSIPELKGRGIDILDIGVGILDAPLLDMKLDVCEVAEPCN